MSPQQIWAAIGVGFAALALLWGAFSLTAALLERPVRAWRWRRAQARQRRRTVIGVTLLPYDTEARTCRCPYVPGPHAHYRRSL